MYVYISACLWVGNSQVYIYDFIYPQGCQITGMAYYWPNVAHWCCISTTWVTSGSDAGLLLDDTKPLSGSVSTYKLIQVILAPCCCACITDHHDDVIKRKYFPRYWPIHQWLVNCPQGPVTRSFDVFFDLHLNKRLNKQRRGWCFETSSHPLWRYCNEMLGFCMDICICPCLWTHSRLLSTSHHFSHKVILQLLVHAFQIIMPTFLYVCVYTCLWVCNSPVHIYVFHIFIKMLNHLDGINPMRPMWRHITIWVTLAHVCT